MGVGVEVSEECAVVERLYHEYASVVYRYAVSSLHNHAEAEDIVQEVFVRVCQSWRSFRGDAQVKTWILRIAHNCIVDAARKRTRLKQLQEEQLRIQECATLMNTVVEIEDLFECVPETQKTVLHLRIVQDLSVADTARVLRCSRGKVRIDTHRALKKVRRALVHETV